MMIFLPAIPQRLYHDPPREVSIQSERESDASYASWYIYYFDMEEI
jgi:hypothetical protein